MTMLLLLSLAAGGCEEEAQIEVYTVPKMASVPTTATDAPRSTNPNVAMQSVPVWSSLPAGWREEAGTGLRYKTLVATVGDEEAEIAVTPLNPQAADLRGNVVRWAGMIGVSDVTDDQIRSWASQMTVDGRDAILVDIPGTLEGEPARMLAVMIEQVDQLWFLRVHGKRSVIDPLAEQFIPFVKSLTFTMTPRAGGPSAGPLAGGMDGELPPGHPPIDGSAGQSRQPTRQPAGQPDRIIVDPPAGWQVAEPGRFLSHKFTLTQNGKQVELTVSKAGGGPLANINRWRSQQLGLQAWDGEAFVNAMQTDPNLVGVDVDGRRGLMLDFTSADGESRIVAAIIDSSDRQSQWFFKLTGPPEIVGEQKQTLQSFLNNVKFESAS